MLNFISFSVHYSLSAVNIQIATGPFKKSIVLRMARDVGMSIYN